MKYLSARTYKILICDNIFKDLIYTQTLIELTNQRTKENQLKFININENCKFFATRIYAIFC